MRICGHAVAVNPESALEKFAKQQDWEIVHWTSWVQILLTRIVIMTDSPFLMEQDDEVEVPSPSKKYQTEKLELFQNKIESSFSSMRTSFEYLMKTINKNPDRIVFDAENINI